MMKTADLFESGVSLVNESPHALIAQRVNSLRCQDKDDPFFICDLGDVVKKYKLWYEQLPRVTPFYAVKCNDDPTLLTLLAQLGAGFDCASKAEIQQILGLDVPTSSIIYANPCKQMSHIRYAHSVNVALTTFDNETELHKIKAAFPKAKLVLRILPPETEKVQCPLGIKFGADPKIAGKLLRLAKELGLDVVGVSFHVGSGCYDANAFADAVVVARTVFDEAVDVGFDVKLLDIGGGFPGHKAAKISFEEICESLRPALDRHFPESLGVRIISEPGRFFAASAFTLAVNVIAKREVPAEHALTDGDTELSVVKSPMFMYYVNDGLYGSFNCLLYDHAEVTPKLLHPEKHVGEPRFKSSVWGPTCDGLDCVSERVMLPELQHGDWLVFADMGAYTISSASSFNNMPKPRVFHVMHELDWRQVNTAAAAAAATGSNNNNSNVHFPPAEKTGRKLLLSELPVAVPPEIRQPVSCVE